MQKNYTHSDASGMRWRFEGSRPVSALADAIMAQVQKESTPAIKTMPIEKLKKGDYFKLVNKKGIASTTVYVYDGYHRPGNAYAYYKFDDVNDWGQKKKGYTVTTEFEF